MKKRLFGTDGIRGKAGEKPLDPPTVRRFGAALAAVLAREAGHPGRVVLGRDTRESGPALRDEVAHGLASAGAVAVEAGIITTPGLAHALLAEGFDAGVMISASHNPYRDNGLKVFGRNGQKLSDVLEREVEDLILEPDAEVPPVSKNGAAADDGLARHYIEHLETVLPHRDRLNGLKLMLDCAHGSASSIAPEVFRHHGAHVDTMGNTPDGCNINLDCGSLHLDGLAVAVRDNGCDLGIAFDGDADRALAVDRKGRIVDGDHILYILARRLSRAGRLRGNGVVATIMSNLWLEKKLASEGVTLHRSQVGDKYVLERMLAEDLVLGGEQSGHVILREHATTGDGILTGLLLVDALLDEGRTLDAILDEIRPYPQIHHAVRVTTKPDLRTHPRIGPAIGNVEAALADTGRVVLRYSGTEPVARVMVEGLDSAEVTRHAAELAELIAAELDD